MKLPRLTSYRILQLVCLLGGIGLTGAPDAAPAAEYRTALFAAG